MEHILASADVTLIVDVLRHVLRTSEQARLEHWVLMLPAMTDMLMCPSEECVYTLQMLCVYVCVACPCVGVHACESVCGCDCERGAGVRHLPVVPTAVCVMCVMCVVCSMAAAAADGIHFVVDAFATVIVSTRAAGGSASIGTDLVREERYRRSCAAWDLLNASLPAARRHAARCRGVANAALAAQLVTALEALAGGGSGL